MRKIFVLWTLLLVLTTGCIASPATAPSGSAPAPTSQSVSEQPLTPTREPEQTPVPMPDPTHQVGTPDSPSTKPAPSKTSRIKEGIISGPSGTKTPDFEDQIFRSLVVSPTDPNFIYVGSEGNGIFKSEDGGETWSWLRNGLLYFPFETPVYAEVYDMVIDPADSERVYAALTNGPGPAEGDYPTAMAGVYVTTDGGGTWVRKINGLANGAAGSIALDPLNSATLYLGINGGIVSFTGTSISGQLFEGGLFKSTDGGNTWFKLELPDPQVAAWSDFWYLIVRDSQKIFVLGQKDEDPTATKAIGLLKSEDAGLTWNKISPEGVFLSSFDVAPQDASTIYGVSYYDMYREDMRQVSTVYKSADGGASWQAVGNLQAYGPVKVSPHDKQTVFLANRKILYKSTDGLQTVEVVLEANEDITDIEFARSDSSTIYAGGKGLLVYKSVDGGNSFSLQANLRDLIEAHR